MSKISDDLPMGFGMALAQNMDAMNRFTNLSDSEKQQIINDTKQVQSKEEMQNLVESLAQTQG